MTDVLERLRAALADRYAIERELGQGGMATVYLARDLKHDRPVALKCLRPELSAVLGIERFLAEIRVTAHLQHPHILPLFDSGDAGGIVWYAMPYVAGESLRRKLDREKQVAVEEAVAIACAVAGALDHAHRHDVIHRDIKPENVLLQDGQPVVADFGIALALSAAAGNRLTETGLSLGTPQYMSPEQATGERAVDRRTDIYSLGCVLYEMLAGAPPFTGPTVQAVLAQVIGDRPRRLSLVRDTVPPHVEAVVFKALSKVPADRFATASHFAEALAKPGLVTLPVDATAERPRVGRRALTSRSSATLFAAGLIIGAAAVGVWAVPRLRQRPPAAPLVRFSFETRRVADGMGVIAVSPNGSAVAYVAEGGQGATGIFVRQLDRTEAVEIPGTRGATQPFFSPDGGRLGFYQDGKLKAVPTQGGVPSSICDAPDLRGASWGPANAIVFAASGPPSTSLFQVSAAGGDPELLATAGPGRAQFYRPHVLPGGKAVLFDRWDGTRSTLALLTLDDRRVTLLPQHGYAPSYVEHGGYVVLFDAGFKVRPFDPRSRRFLGPVRPFAPGTRSQVYSDFGTLGISRSGVAAFLPGPSPAWDLVILDRQGRVEVLPVAPDFYDSPRFAPDGSRLAVTISYPTFGNAADIWIYDVALRTLTRLTFDSTSTFPEWGPDGRRVIHAGTDSAIAPDWDLRWVSAESAGSPQSLLARPNSQWQGLLTPDTRSLIFWEYGARTGGDVWVTPVDTPSAARPLATKEAWEAAVALSPDGRWLAYHSDESGRAEVYVRPLAPGGTRRQVSSGGSHPRWGPGGRELFFRHGDSLYVVPITPGRELGIGRARPLLVAPSPQRPVWWSHDYDVSPDGQRFVFVRRRPDERQRIEVLLNWFDHVEGDR